MKELRDLLRFGDQSSTMPDVVYTEHFRATLHFEDETDTHQYQIVFKRLQESALGELESLDFIEQIVRRVWT